MRTALTSKASRSIGNQVFAGLRAPSIKDEGSGKHEAFLVPAEVGELFSKGATELKTEEIPLPLDPDTGRP